MLETAVQLESDPPETATSDSMKSVDASEREKVRVAVSPVLREEVSEVRAMVAHGFIIGTVEFLRLVSAATES